MNSALLDTLLEAKTAKRPTALVTDLEGGAQALVIDGAEHGELALDDQVRGGIERALRRDKGETVESAGKRLFIQPFAPPKRMILVGAVHIAQSLAPMAKLTGYDVVIVDPRQAFTSRERFPGAALNHDWPDDALTALAPDRRTAVVTLTHDPKLDDPALSVALRSDAFYIGALGSTRTHGRRLERLREAGFGDNDFARIHGPIGLDIGAVSPAEIAISIMGEVTRTLHAPAEDGK
ncbi:MAG: XdhC family protein [Alphaproteobacteria bacterium]|jgi:xanthine dehydrogenase accessory factor|nr:XdhC family protein [Alphaproteobacteria bacterium]